MASVYTTYFTKQWEETIFEGVILFLSTDVLRIYKWQIHLVCTTIVNHSVFYGFFKPSVYSCTANPFLEGHSFWPQKYCYVTF